MKLFSRVAVAIVAVALVIGGLSTPEPIAAQGKGAMTFEVYKDAKGEYRWRLKAGNGKIMAVASEGYKTKANCESAISTIKAGAGKAKVEEVEKE